MPYRRLIALMILSTFLFIPPDSYANLELPSLHDGALVPAISSNPTPASQHPCSHRQDRDGCEPGCSCCSCSYFFAQAPYRMVFLPNTTPLLFLEPIQRFPQVFPPTFGPPPRPA
jgi:hypothetical protein